MLEKENTSKDGIRNVYLALYFIGAVLSGAGGNYLWLRTTGPDIVAPDRFTASQASSLVNQANRIERILSNHLSQHPDRTNQYDRRIATLEAQYINILANQQRILDRIDGK